MFMLDELVDNLLQVTAEIQRENFHAGLWIKPTLIPRPVAKDPRKPGFSFIKWDIISYFHQKLFVPI